MWQVLSARKSFAEPYIGNPRLNDAGLHLWRIALADRLLALRRWQLGGESACETLSLLKSDGIVVIRDFLPANRFTRLQAVAFARMRAADAANPIQGFGERGFGSRHVFDWGFDRYDGGSLNRFYSLPDDGVFAHWLQDQRLTSLVSLGAGSRCQAGKFHLYRLVQGDEGDNPDIQRQPHKDTFHSAIKLWYSLTDVTAADGPFRYAVGSHRMTATRKAWEYQRSCEAARTNRGGAFRIGEDEIREIYGVGLSDYPVPANTLVLADVRGFHARGLAQPGRERLSIYGSVRPMPFRPWA